MNRSGSFDDRCGRYTRHPGSALRTTPACSASIAASASPLPFAARIFATTVSTFAMEGPFLGRRMARGRGGVKCVVSYRPLRFSRRITMSQRVGSLLALFLSCVLALVAPAAAQDKPRSGGELLFVVAAEPPS